MMNMQRIVRQIVREAGVGLTLILMCVIFAVIAPHFATLNNVKNIFTQISINTILAVGMTFVILTGGIDLSVGSVMALSTVACGSMMKTQLLPEALAIFLAIGASLLVGMLCGLMNGYISERWKLPSFIVTLGMLNIARGVALFVTDARTLFSFPKSFLRFGSGTILGGLIPLIFLVSLTLVALGQFVLSQTLFGRYILAIGNNEEAVRLSGHKTSLYKILVFAICGLTAGIAGVTYMARLTIANPILGTGFELNAIAAVIIGGTSLSGGKGSLIGTFFGACIMGVLTNGLILMGVGDFVRQIITGGVIIVAVILDFYRAKVSFEPVSST